MANLCSSCKTEFGSVSAFDAHRVGNHNYTYSEGLALTPAREDGRRCLRNDELENSGFVVNKRGTWSLVNNLVAIRGVQGTENSDVAYERPDTEDLTCHGCGTVFSRKVVRGRKPKLCATCKAA